MNCRFTRQRMEACSLYDSIGDVVKSLTQCPMSHELETFSRLLYRNKNQHRRDRCFQKLVRVWRVSDYSTVPLHYL